MIDRRGFLAASAALAACSQVPSVSQDQTLTSKKLMAVTMDDFGLDFDVKLTPRERNDAILAALSAHNHKAAGFVTGEFVNSDTGRAIVQSWSDAGHLIGNHTWSHMNSSEEDTAVIKADILKNDTVLSQFQTYEKIFRFPFLAEGGTPEKIADYRAFMAVNGFANAPVTISSMDWFTSGRLEKRLAGDSQADVKGYRDYYVKAVRDISEQKHQLALRLGYTDLPHTLLVHHNILNGLFLKDVMDALVSDGWSFVDAKAALSHPLYALQPETPNKGRSVLSVLAQEQDVDAKFPPAYLGWGRVKMESLGL